MCVGVSYAAGDRIKPETRSFPLKTEIDSLRLTRKRAEGAAKPTRSAILCHETLTFPIFFLFFVVVVVVVLPRVVVEILSEGTL